MESETQTEALKILAIIVPSAITVVGFVVSYIINKRNHYQSIQQIKTEKQISDLYNILNDVFELLDMLLLLYAQRKDMLNGFQELKKRIYSTIFSAGSKDAVNIMAYIQEMAYSGIDDGVEVPSYQLIASYVLLAMQIKYDVTGVEVSPLTWYKGRFTTQKMLSVNNFYDDSIIAINNIVDQLKLKAFLRIDET